MKNNKIVKLLSIQLLTIGIVTNVNSISANAAWKKNNTGWWYTEGNSYAKGWRKISGVWYYFNGNGYMETGWLRDNNKWYYLDSSGAMKTGWVKVSGEWYYFNNSGEMQTGWVMSSGKWYYMDSSGFMRTGWFKDSKEDCWYYLMPSGEMATSVWVEDNNKMYYLQESGVMYRGAWFNQDNKVYLFDSNGAMCTGWKDDRYGNTFYFDENGVAARGITTIDGVKYYFNHQTNQLKRNINNSYISTDADGKITKYDDSNMEDVIYANDSSYIEKLKVNYGELTFSNPEFTSTHYQFSEFGNLYEISGEEAKLIYISSNVNGEKRNVALYLIGLETGNVYSVQDKRGSKVYEVKDNKIVNKYRDVITLNNADWR